jgi:hypothetical protein
MVATMKRSMSLVALFALAPFASAFTHQQQASAVTLSRSNRPNVVTLAMAADPDLKKETTWDRITGPKLFKTVTNWEGIHSVPLVPLRILTGMLMIHHGSEG